VAESDDGVGFIRLNPYFSVVKQVHLGGRKGNHGCNSYSQLRSLASIMRRISRITEAFLSRASIH
jgi:hypothetical protein